MSRLPTIHGDTNNWGGVLNDYLTVAHNADGTIKKGASDHVYVVAASNSLATHKSRADYVCDGTADDVELNAAITAAASFSGLSNPNTGCTILVCPGTYNLAAAVDFNPLATIGEVPVIFDAESAVFHAAANLTSMFIIGYTGVAASW